MIMAITGGWGRFTEATVHPNSWTTICAKASGFLGISIWEENQGGNVLQVSQHPFFFFFFVQYVIKKN